MKVKSLKLINFRNHRMNLIEFKKKINFVFGANGAGKTSILDGLCYLLLGRNIRTSKSGSGSNDLITFGEGRAMLEGEINDTKVTRTIPHTLQIADWEGGIRDQQKKLEELVGVDGDKIDVCLNSTLFTDMSSSEKKAFLFDIMDTEITDELVKNEFIAWGREKGIRDPDQIIEYSIRDYGLEFNSESSIDKASDIFVARRKVLKRDIKEAQVKLEKPENSLPEGINLDSEETVRAKLDELKETHVGIIGKIREYRGRTTELQKTISGTIVEGDIKEELGKQKKYQDTMNKVTAEITEIVYKRKELEIEKEKLTNWSGKCPVLAGTTCPIDGFDMTDMVKKIDEKIDAIAREETSIFSREQKGNALISENRKLISKLSDGVTKKDKNKAEAELVKIKEEYDIETLTKQAAETEQRVKKGEDILHTILGEKSKMKDIERSRVKLDNDEKELTNIEILCNGFGPNGLKSIILRRVMVPIREQAKARMLAMSRNEIEMDIRLEDNDLSIYMITNGMEREFNYLSKSEKLRVQIVIQDVVARATGLKFLVIDEVDALDKENRKGFINLLKGIQDDYDTIIALCTGESYGMDDEIHEIDLGG